MGIGICKSSKELSQNQIQVYLKTNEFLKLCLDTNFKSQCNTKFELKNKSNNAFCSSKHMELGKFKKKVNDDEYDSNSKEIGIKIFTNEGHKRQSLQIPNKSSDLHDGKIIFYIR